MRDVTLGDTEYFKFTTRAFASGAPTTLSGTPAISVYEQNNLTQITAGITLTVDYDSVTGLNDVAVVASAGNGYEAGKTYHLVITTGTVGGVSVVGEVVGEFSVESGAALLLSRIIGTLATGTHNPQSGDAYAIVNNGTYGNAQLVRATTPANTLDINATGEAGADVVRINNQAVTAAAPVTVNAEIGASAVAMNAFEDQYDGTGLTGDTYPANQAQVGAIGSATGGGLVFQAVGDNVLGALKGVTFVGVQTGGTYANTEAEDNVYHNITHSGNAIDIVYQFAVGGARTASEVILKGYLSSANDTLTIQMYDFVGADWETRGFLSGQGGTTNVTQSVKFLSKHTGTSGADLGQCYVRFLCTGMTAPDFFVDELVVEAFSEGQSVGYANGAIWIDTVGGTAGTELYVNGVADNPVDSLANANTISSTLGIDRFHLSNDSSITLASSHVNDEFIGSGWTLALGGQAIDNAHFVGAINVSGTGTSASDCHFEDCELDSVTLGIAHLIRCGLAGTLTISNAGTYTLDTCYSKVAGAGAPVIDMGAAVGATSVNIRRYDGGLTVNNLAAGDTMTIGGTLGTVTLNGTGGDIEIRGTYKAIVDNRSGGALNTEGAVRGKDVEDVLADTADMQPRVMSIEGDTNELQTDWTNDGRLDVILDARASQTTADAIENDTQNIQSRLPAALVSGRMDSNTSAIDNNNTAAINLKSSMLGIVPTTVNDVSATTTSFVTALTEATNDHYNGRIIVFTSGALANQATDITDYDGTTKAVTVTALTEAPANGVTFVIV